MEIEQSISNVEYGEYNKVGRQTNKQTFFLRQTNIFGRQTFVEDTFSK